MNPALPFEQIGRLPAPGDNVAIAVRTIEAGSVIEYAEGGRFTLPHTILEGHRFAIAPIKPEAALLSWGLPFGFATRDIAPGEYICNEKILWALRQRHVNFPLPAAANFRDYHVPFQLDASKFRPGRQVDRFPHPKTFNGFAREGGRGAGTRNYIAILGTTSRTASYARALAERFKNVPTGYRNIDGVVAISHTEGASELKPNNLEFVLRTLAGFMVHPNIAAVLAVDIGIEFANNARLRQYMIENNYPLDHLLHRFWTISGNFLPSLDQGEKVVREWLDPVNRCQRSAQPLEHLRIGLQCGGSDAFSGVSGNPLVGWVTKELVRHGGSANLAETDELIGAEPYILSNIKDLPTAGRFLNTISRFQERTGWHGHSGEGNPSGGNNFRGLYNIAVKSIGAARKKDPEVSVDYVIDYSTPMRSPGFYFMDSPGNDLESVAGQVGAGCNLILFTTGNGSITNFPFVPTIKVMTNTGRFKLLSHEMDVNAGRYLDGAPMEQLGRETFDLTLRVASGERSAGERAGHSQVQLWRDWRQTNASQLEEILRAPVPDGQPLPIQTALGGHVDDVKFEMLESQGRLSSDQVGLIVPTSLCAGQVARMIADRLNSERPAHSGKVSRYLALTHTEGCGASSGDSEQLFLRTMAGYLCHPLVRKGLLLEHGCEKTHNDAMREFFETHLIDHSKFGTASVQLDGGLEKVTRKVLRWFADDSVPPAHSRSVGMESIRLALTAEPGTPGYVISAAATLAGRIIQAGGTVVIPDNSFLLHGDAFLKSLLGNRPALRPTLAYGQPFQKAGFHIMQTPTEHSVETLTGLGATGVEVMIVCVTKAPWQSHPMVPVLQVSQSPISDDIDLIAGPRDPGPGQLSRELLTLVIKVLTREYSPKLFAQGNTDFQMTRGLLGVSL